MDNFSRIPQNFKDEEHNYIVSALQHVISGGPDGVTTDYAEAATQPQQQQQLAVEYEYATSSFSQPTTGVGALTMMMDVGSNTGWWGNDQFEGATTSLSHSTSSTGAYSPMMIDVGGSTEWWDINHQVFMNDQVLEDVNHDRDQQKQKEKKKKYKKKRTKQGGNNVNYRGVRLKSGKWVAEIRNPHKAKTDWLGYFNSPEEAARAYDRKAIQYRGNQANTNFPLSDYANEDLPSSSSQPPPTAMPIYNNVPAENSPITNITGGVAIPEHHIANIDNYAIMTNSTASTSASGTNVEENPDSWLYQLLENDDILDPELMEELFSPPPSTP